MFGVWCIKTRRVGPLVGGGRAGNAGVQLDSMCVMMRGGGEGYAFEKGHVVSNTYATTTTRPLMYFAYVV
jgi:hypothetical protein